MKRIKIPMDIKTFNESWDSDLIKPINATSPLLVCFNSRNCIEKVLQDGDDILVNKKDDSVGKINLEVIDISL